MTQELITILLPIIVVVAGALLLLLVDQWIPERRKGISALLAAAVLAAALGLNLAVGARSAGLVDPNSMVVLDSFAVFLNTLFLASGLMAIALAYDYLKRMQMDKGEYYVLLMIAISGMMLMAQAYDLIMVFLALELLSIPLYILSGFARKRPESEEAALKYFLLGTFASGFVLYGVAMIFGATARTDLPGILAATVSAPINAPLFLIGAALLMVGFGFKVAAVPFHKWTPDVYQGAPSPVTAFMSVGVKAAGFAALMRVFTLAFPSLAADLSPVMWALAALTMLLGNVLAVAQTNIKRLLAYSSIAQAGYMLMAFVPYGDTSAGTSVTGSLLFYLVAYGLTSLGAWAVVVALEQAEGRGLSLEDYAGLGRKYPWLGAAMVVFMLSFTGVPITLGFWGKLYLFRTVVESGFISLALIGLLTSLVSAFYYLRVVVFMYMRTGEAQASRDVWLNLTAVVAALAVLGLSVAPGLLFDLASRVILLVQ